MPKVIDIEQAPVHLVHLRRDRFRSRIGELMRVYASAFEVSGGQVDRQREIVLRHTSYPGFTAVGAELNGALVGFCYGTKGADDQWWHRQVAPAFSEESRQTWLSDYFCLIELAVDPALQGKGVGRRLVEELLARVDDTYWRCLVMTDMANARAKRLYESLGYSDVLAGFRFTGSGDAKRIMGRVSSAGPP